MTILENQVIQSPRRNRIRDTLRQNHPIDTTLHVIMVVSNPCEFKRRYELALQFIDRMSQEENVSLYVVELCYKDQPFVLTHECPSHLQLRTEDPLWHKENMINCGTQLLPEGWKAMAWIDADLEFESSTWAIDTLKLLNGYADVVQLFSHAVDMDKSGRTMTVSNSAGYQYEKGLPMGEGANYWHPGYAWACTRAAYDQMGGLYENAILGSGDHVMLCALLGQVDKAIHEKSELGYKADARVFQSRTRHLRFSYVPGVIRHHYHGTKANRKYRERWSILVEHRFESSYLLKKDSLLVPSDTCPPKLLADILQYFKERNEDDP